MRIDKSNKDVFILNNNKVVQQTSQDVKSGLLNFSEQKSDNAWNTEFSNTQNAEMKTHSIIKGLQVDSEGKIDNSQFTLENLKKKYPEDKYKISPLEGGGFHICENDGTSVLDIYLENGGLYRYVEYNSNSKISFDVSSGKVVCSEEKFSDGAMDIKIYDRKTSKLTIKQQFDKDGNFIGFTKYLKDGSVLRSVVAGVVESPFVDNIIKNLNSGGDNFLFLSENILNNVDKTNIEGVLFDYERKTGKNLVQDIFNSSIPESIKHKLGSHLEKLRIGALPPQLTSSFISGNIDMANSQKNFQAMDDIFDFITPENVAYVLSSFENYIKEEAESMGKVSGEPEPDKPTDESEPTVPKSPDEDWPEPTEPEAVDELPDITDYINYSFIDDSTIPRRSLLEEISNMDWLTQEQKDKYINHIIDCAIKHSDGGNLDDVKQDIAEHRRDMRKLEVDLVRVINRSNYVSRNTQITEPNGKIDAPVRQGATGDCWLISGIHAISLKPEGAKYLEALVKKDETTGNYTVTLNHEGEPYPITISPDEIKNARHLSSGDGDMRIWELAFDKYFKDQAYNSNARIGGVDEDDDSLGNNQYDITGDYLSTVTKLLYGRGTSRSVNLKSEDFNNSDKVYQISIASYLTEAQLPQLTDENGRAIKMFSNHAYSIVGSDEENVYLVNPHDTSKTYTVSRKALEECGGYSVESFNLN